MPNPGAPESCLDEIRGLREIHGPLGANKKTALIDHGPESTGRLRPAPGDSQSPILNPMTFNKGDTWTEIPTSQTSWPRVL